MFDLEIIISPSEMPTSAVYLSLSLDEKTLRVTVSPNIEAAVLQGLAPQIAEAVGNAVRNAVR